MQRPFVQRPLSKDFELEGSYHHRMVVELKDDSPGSEADDGLLMTRIAARDEDALRALYDRHAPTLLALCLRIVGDRTDAEQILLDVFWETWNRAVRYDAGRSAPRTYLTLLTRSRALDARRRRKSVDSGDARNDFDSTARLTDSSAGSTASAPLNHLLASEQAQSLRDALLSLEDEERSLIEACFYDGFTHVEIAAKLRQPLGTVKTRIRRGLTRLRTRLGHLFDETRDNPASASPPTPRGAVADESEVR